MHLIKGHVPLTSADPLGLGINLYGTLHPTVEQQTRESHCPSTLPTKPSIHGTMARYDVNEDLATAVRDVVHINRNGLSQPVSSGSRLSPGTAENPFEEGHGNDPAGRTRFAVR